MGVQLSHALSPAHHHFCVDCPARILPSLFPCLSSLALLPACPAHRWGFFLSWPRAWPASSSAGQTYIFPTRSKRPGVQSWQGKRCLVAFSEDHFTSVFTLIFVHFKLICLCPCRAAVLAALVYSWHLPRLPWPRHVSRASTGSRNCTWLNVLSVILCLAFQLASPPHPVVCLAPFHLLLLFLQ